MDGKYSMLDLNNCVYEEWQEQGKLRFGMRHKLTGKRHDLVRTVELNGSIYEASYKDGRMHGLYRWICDNGMEAMTPTSVTVSSMPMLS